MREWIEWNGVVNKKVNKKQKFIFQSQIHLGCHKRRQNCKKKIDVCSRIFDLIILFHHNYTYDWIYKLCAWTSLRLNILFKIHLHQSIFTLPRQQHTPSSTIKNGFSSSIFNPIQSANPSIIVYFPAGLCSTEWEEAPTLVLGVASTAPSAYPSSNQADVASYAPFQFAVLYGVASFHSLYLALF